MRKQHKQAEEKQSEITITHILPRKPPVSFENERFSWKSTTILIEHARVCKVHYSSSYLNIPSLVIIEYNSWIILNLVSMNSDDLMHFHSNLLVFREFFNELFIAGIRSSVVLYAI